MLQGESRRKDEKKDKLAILKKSVREMTAVRKFSKSDGVEVGMEAEPFEKSVDFIAIPAALPVDDDTPRPRLRSRSDSRFSASGSSPMSPTSGKIDRIREFHEDLEGIAMEKRKKDEAKLELKIRRAKEIQKKKAAKLQDAAQEWEIKFQRFANKREQEAIKNDGSYEARQRARTESYNEMTTQIEQEREDNFNAKALAQQNVKAASQKIEEDARKDYQEKIEQKFANNKERLEEIQKTWESKTVSAEVVREKCKKKEEYELAFKSGTVEEIEKKKKRADEARRRTAKPLSTEEALQQQRLLRQDKIARGRLTLGNELALPPELSLPDQLFLSPKSAKSTSGGVPDSLSMEESPSPPLQSSPRPEDAARPQRLPLPELAMRGRKGSVQDPTPKSLASVSPAKSTGDLYAGGASSRRSSKDSGSDDGDGENDFLDALQQSSAKWLNDIRRKSQQDGLTA
jgi:hypothetical protein